TQRTVRILQCGPGPSKAQGGQAGRRGRTKSPVIARHSEGWRARRICISRRAGTRSFFVHEAQPDEVAVGMRLYPGHAGELDGLALFELQLDDADRVERRLHVTRDPQTASRPNSTSTATRSPPWLALMTTPCALKGSRISTSALSG